MTAMDRLSVADRLRRIGSWLQTMKDGRIKLWVIRQSLHCRRNCAALFAAGEYLPLRIAGLKAPHVFAFIRKHEHQLALCVIPRLIASLVPSGNHLPVGQEIWGDTRIELPEAFKDASLENILTGEVIAAHRSAGSVSVQLSEAFASLPVALFRGTIQD
jgi:(1->4)-alpha-D-glucan 1-alpha-D-glucosylmutase